MEQNLIYIWEWLGQNLDNPYKLIGSLAFMGFVVCLMYAVIFMREE